MLIKSMPVNMAQKKEIKAKLLVCIFIVFNKYPRGWLFFSSLFL